MFVSTLSEIPSQSPIKLCMYQSPVPQHSLMGRTAQLALQAADIIRSTHRDHTAVGWQMLHLSQPESCGAEAALCAMQGATVVDFAYHVHTAVGNQMIGARVNDKMVAPSHVLVNADVVEIVTYNAKPSPQHIARHRVSCLMTFLVCASEYSQNIPHNNLMVMRSKKLVALQLLCTLLCTLPFLKTLVATPHHQAGHQEAD